MLGGIFGKEQIMNNGKEFRMGICAALFVAGALFLPVRCEATDFKDLKLGHVSLPDVYNASQRLKAAVQEIEDLRTNSQAQLSIVAKEIQEINDKLRKGRGTLKPEEEEALRTELKEKSEKLESGQNDVRVKAAFKQRSVQNVLKHQIPKALEEVAKKRELSIILWDSALAYGPQVPNVSKEVAEVLDAMPAVEKGPDQAPPAQR
jgi:Skp family chaperone for outer membrane proteins